MWNDSHTGARRVRQQGVIRLQKPKVCDQGAHDFNLPMKSTEGSTPPTAVEYKAQHGRQSFLSWQIGVSVSGVVFILVTD